MKTTTFILPTYLASALINGDTSGLDGTNDMAALVAAEDLADGGSYIDVSDDTWFSRQNDLPGRAGRLGGAVATYTVLCKD